MNRCAAAATVLLMACAASAEGPAGPPMLLKAEDLPIAVEQVALKKQFDALSVMPSVVVEYSTHGPISSVQGDTGLVLPKGLRELEEGDSADRLLELVGPLLLATGRESLTVVRATIQPLGRGDIRADQYIRGMPVVFGTVSVGFDELSGRMYGVWSNFVPDRGLPTQARLSAEQAWQAIVHALETSGDAVPGTASTSETPSLAYFGMTPFTDRPHLVWTIRSVSAWRGPGDRHVHGRAGRLRRRAAGPHRMRCRIRRAGADRVPNRLQQPVPAELAAHAYATVARLGVRAERGRRIRASVHDRGGRSLPDQGSPVQRLRLRRLE